MDMYTGDRAWAIAQSGEHGTDQHSGGSARPISRHYLPFLLDNCFFSVEFLYKSPSQRMRENQFATALSL